MPRKAKPKAETAKKAPTKKQTATIIATDGTNSAELTVELLPETNKGEITYVWVNEALNITPETTEVVQAPTDGLETISDNQATNVLPEGENGVEVNTDVLEGIVEEVPTPYVNPFEQEGVFNGILDESKCPLDGHEKPIPSVSLLLKSHKITDLIKHMLYVASLGGDLDTSKYPSIKRLPYFVHMILPIDKEDIYINKQEMVVFDPEVSYLTRTVTALDVPNLFKTLVKLGKKGFIIPPTEAVKTFPSYSVIVCGRHPIKDEPFNRSMGSGILYTEKELNAMSFEDLRLVGSRYGISHRTKFDLIGKVLREQEKINN